MPRRRHNDYELVDVAVLLAIIVVLYFIAAPFFP